MALGAFSNIHQNLSWTLKLPIMSHLFREDQLLDAVEHGDVDRVAQLLSSGISMNAVLLSRARRESATVLATAAYEGQVKIMRYLLDCGAAVNHQDPLLRRNALHWACTGGHPDAVKLLVEHKTDVNCVDRDNVTPLIRAAILGQFDIVCMLIDSGADVNKFDRLHCSALHYATYSGNSDLTRAIIQAGCVANNFTIFGQGTPLANLVYHDDVGNVRLLIDAGYDLFRDGWVTERFRRGDCAGISPYVQQEYRNPRSLMRLCCTVIRRQMKGVYVRKKILSLSLPIIITKQLTLDQ